MPLTFPNPNCRRFLNGCMLFDAVDNKGNRVVCSIDQTALDDFGEYHDHSFESYHAIFKAHRNEIFDVASRLHGIRKLDKEGILKLHTSDVHPD